MKRPNLVSSVVFSAFLLFSCASSPEVSVAMPMTEAPTWSPAAVLEGDQIHFYFDSALLLEGLEPPVSVGLAGTFTGWKNSESFHLARIGESNRWSGSFPRSLIDVPGNSGLPEFQFVLNGDARLSGNIAPIGESWGSNFVVLVPPETRETMEAKDRLNRKLRSEYDSVEALSNFRSLAGGILGKGVLNRSYHPFIPSRSLPGEKERLLAVQSLMESRGIQGVINLTDSPGLARTGQAPDYYQKLINSGGVAFLPTEYNTVYYESDQEEFKQELKGIFSFLESHQGPYLVHCRLGTDRTGVISGILEALAGVSWDTIVADYELSNRLEIREYRSPRLLEYSFTRMLGTSPAAEKDLAASMKKFLLASGIPQNTLDKVLKNLSGQT